jgi:hypothetical protein
VVINELGFMLKKPTLKKPKELEFCQRSTKNE